MPTPQKAAEAAVPRRFGRYELRRVLGKGAHATVWLAHDPRLDREVAIKVLRPVQAGVDAELEPWLREARNVGRLSHAHIATLFEADARCRPSSAQPAATASKCSASCASTEACCDATKSSTRTTRVRTWRGFSPRRHAVVAITARRQELSLTSQLGGSHGSGAQPPNTAKTPMAIGADAHRDRK